MRKALGTPNFESSKKKKDESPRGWAGLSAYHAAVQHRFSQYTCTSSCEVYCHTINGQHTASAGSMSSAGGRNTASTYEQYRTQGTSTFFFFSFFWSHVYFPASGQAVVSGVVPFSPPVRAFSFDRALFRMKNVRKFKTMNSIQSRNTACTRSMNSSSVDF